MVYLKSLSVSELYPKDTHAMQCLRTTALLPLQSWASCCWAGYGEGAYCRNRISHKPSVTKEILIIWIVSFHSYNLIETLIWNRSEEKKSFSEVVPFLNFDRRYHNDDNGITVSIQFPSSSELMSKFCIKFLHSSPGKEFIGLTVS